ncbi:Uncharacterized protein PA52Ts32_3768 [Pseudomonas aeruginosa]|nr:hypothetical protein CSC30_6139 [Pseudomonas aeruginosa]QJE91534.1 Uncharacterized protein PA52Ts17_3746 [Pseudomonas aeruginosa]QLJ89662.1 Uncharacterized protein PA52Ts32_3768 [Pseudomonas aeruginosa]RCH22045.1 hypothetical protein CSC42_6601 [Pseudomonas aeruginosa]
MAGNRFRRAGVGVEGPTGMTAINPHALSSLQSGKEPALHEIKAQ